MKPARPLSQIPTLLSYHILWEKSRGFFGGFQWVKRGFSGDLQKNLTTNFRISSQRNKEFNLFASICEP